MSVQRWTAYVEDDDGNDLFVSHQQDAQGQWVRYDDHVAELEEQLEQREAELHATDLARLEATLDRYACVIVDLAGGLELYDLPSSAYRTLEAAIEALGIGRPALRVTTDEGMKRWSFEDPRVEIWQIPVEAGS